LNSAVAVIVLPSLTRFAGAATSVTGPPGVRERLRLLQAEELDEDGARALGAELDLLAVLLTRR
jgi:hypothetical protein